MRKNTRSGYTRSYNCEATVDAEGSGLIVDWHLTQSVSDTNELIHAYQSILAELGKPTALRTKAGARCANSKIRS